MTTHTITRLLAICLTSLTLAVADDRPNIIVILSDDMGFSDLGCYGSEIETPALDSLAKNGIRFTEFYATSRCWPTRATLLSGHYSSALEKTQVSIAQLLKPAGYQTGMVGKWHLSMSATENGPRQRGFDTFYGTLIGAGSFWHPDTLTRDTEPAEIEEGFYYTDKIGTEAVAQIERFAKQDAPFFQYIAFTAAHWPMHAPEASIQKYMNHYKDGWAELRKKRYARMLELGVINETRWPLTPPEKRVKDWDTLEHKEWYIRNMACYAAMIDHMDQAVGKVIAALKRTKAFDNTLIIYTNDNGACSERLGGNGWGTCKNVIRMAKEQGKTLTVGDDVNVPNGGPWTYGSVGPSWANAQNTPLRRYKSNVHEGGACVPCIMHWPAKLKNPGTITDQRGHVVDILATCLDLAKTSYPATLGDQPLVKTDSVSLVPTITGNKQDPQHPYYFNHANTYALIKGDWKIVREGTKGPWELYNLKADKVELNNLAQQKPEIVQGLEKIWGTYADTHPMR